MNFKAGVQLYFRKGKDVMAVKLAQCEAGFWVGQPPAKMFDVSDYSTLKEFLQETLSVPASVVPTPARDAFLAPKDLGLPFEKGWRALQNRYETLSVFHETDGYELNAYFPDGNWSKEQSKAFVARDAFDAVVNETFSRISSQQDEA